MHVDMPGRASGLLAIGSGEIAHNDSATQVSASSCFVNPTSTHDDRELPELAANGTFVTADGMTKSG